MKQKLYAFWKHDQFPYCLGGEITDIRFDGAVETVGYGKGYWFQPFKILPLAEGLELFRKLQDLRAEYDAAKAAVVAEYHTKVSKLIKIPKE